MSLILNVIADAAAPAAEGFLTPEVVVTLIPAAPLLAAHCLNIRKIQRQHLTPYWV